MGKRPELFQSTASIRRKMTNLGNALVSSTLDVGEEAANKNQPKGTQVKRKPKYLEVTQERLDQLGVIDLKPYFARSSQKTHKKGGGWYLTIPIARRAKDMSSRMYRQLNQTNIAPAKQKTVVSDYLYDRRRESGATMLNYTPRSKTIDKINQGKKRHTYVAFRRVSDTSPANSWIVNRDRVNEQNQSKTFVDNVNRLMKWKMKNGWD